MRDNRGVEAESGGGHGKADRQGGALSERPHERPGEGGIALLWGPWLEMLADHEAGREAGGLCPWAPVEQIGWMELLEHRGVTDLRHGNSLQVRVIEASGTGRTRR